MKMSQMLHGIYLYFEKKFVVDLKFKFSWCPVFFFFFNLAILRRKADGYLVHHYVPSVRAAPDK